LLKRLEDPDKNWKFSVTDLSERSKWKDYMDAYEELLTQTSTEWAPWYVIPADKKWVTHASISGIIVSQIKKLNLNYPKLTPEQSEGLAKAKADLQKD
jgi:polyphosphate kinase 2 (PPK2 family)